MSALIPNSFQVPNAYIDQLWHLLTPDEKDVLIYTARRIFGFNKRQDNISLSQYEHGIIASDGTPLDHGTGLSRSRIIAALHGLMKYGIQKQEAENDPHTRRGACYSLQLDMDQVDLNGLEKRLQESRKEGQKRTIKARQKRREKRHENASEKTPESTPENGDRLDSQTSSAVSVSNHTLEGSVRQSNQSFEPSAVLLTEKRPVLLTEKSAVRLTNPHVPSRNPVQNPVQIRGGGGVLRVSGASPAPPPPQKKPLDKSLLENPVVQALCEVCGVLPEHFKPMDHQALAALLPWLAENVSADPEVAAAAVREHFAVDVWNGDTPPYLSQIARLWNRMDGTLKKRQVKNGTGKTSRGQDAINAVANDPAILELCRRVTRPDAL